MNKASPTRARRKTGDTGKGKQKFRVTKPDNYATLFKDYWGDAAGVKEVKRRVKKKAKKK